MSSSCTSLAIPKSVTLHVFPSPTSTLRAARSLWITLNKEKTFLLENTVWRNERLEGDSADMGWHPRQWVHDSVESEVYWVTNEWLYHSLVSMTNRTFHQRFAKQISSAAVRSDLFVVWYPGLCSKYHLIHGSFSDNPADPQKEHIRSAQTVALGRQTNFRKYSTTCRRWKQNYQWTSLSSKRLSHLEE